MKSRMVPAQVIDLGCIDINIYKCISDEIDIDKVVLTNKQYLHILERHPEADDKDLLMGIRKALESPDYILRDEKHSNTGIVIKAISGESVETIHSNIVLRICTDSKEGRFANSVISRWEISDNRLQNYLRNKPVLYKRA